MSAVMKFQLVDEYADPPETPKPLYIAHRHNGTLMAREEQPAPCLFVSGPYAPDDAMDYIRKHERRVKRKRAIVGHFGLTVLVAGLTYLAWSAIG